MKIDRYLLEDKIDDWLVKVYSSKAVQEKFCERMNRLHNVQLGRATAIFGRNVSIKEVSKEMLLWTTIELREAVKDSTDFGYLANEISVEKFFTEIEISEMANNMLPKESSKDVFPIVIDRVLKVNNDQFVTTKSVDFVKEMRDKQVIQYNPKTQRELTKKNTSSGVRFVITIVQRVVREIMSLMKTGKFISNAITWNLDADSDAYFEYDEDNLILTIFKGVINITDGNHRYISMTNCKDDDENFDYNTIINITYFGEDKAKRYIAQEYKRTKMAKSKLKSLDIDNYGTVIVTNLNENLKSNLLDKIGTAKGSDINFGLLAEIVNFYLPITEEGSALIKMKKFTLEAFNLLIENDMSLIEQRQPDLKWLMYGRVIKNYYDNGDINEYEKNIELVKNIDVSNLNIKTVTIGKTLSKKIDATLKSHGVTI